MHTYGQDWETYWEKWNSDTEWMELLHKAEFGDILHYDWNLNLYWFEFASNNEGNLRGVINITPDILLEDWSGASLDFFFETIKNRYNYAAISLVNISSNNDIEFKEIIGNLRYDYGTYTNQEIDADNALVDLTAYVVCPLTYWGIAGLPGLIVGGIQAATTGYFSRSLDDLGMHLQEGDKYIRFYRLKDNSLDREYFARDVLRDGKALPWR